MVRKQNFSRKKTGDFRSAPKHQNSSNRRVGTSNLKSDYPDLSLGTVYRNLAQFKEEYYYF